MKKLLSHIIISIVSLSGFLPTFAQSQQNPVCEILINGISKKAHVWYTLNNKDNNYSWYVQIARNYEDNISFVDESCNPVEFGKKFELLANTTKKVGMIVEVEKSFNSIYSFTGVRNDSSLTSVPNHKMMCLFMVAPYGPRQMDRTDWKLNNSDCYATNFGTELNFK